MRTLSPVFLILAVAACSSPADGILDPEDPEPTPTPVIVLSSLHSGIEQEARFAIRSQVAWQAFWEQLHASGLEVEPQPPPVDFAASMVVVAALGARERAGHHIAIPAFHRDAGVLTVTVLKTAPGPGCPASPVFTTPAAVAVLPAAPSLTFLEVEEQAPCAGD